MDVKQHAMLANKLQRFDEPNVFRDTQVTVTKDNDGNP